MRRKTKGWRFEEETALDLYKRLKAKGIELRVGDEVLVSVDYADVVQISGDVGAGKSALVKSILASLLRESSVREIPRKIFVIDLQARFRGVRVSEDIARCTELTVVYPSSWIEFLASLAKIEQIIEEDVEYEHYNGVPYLVILEGLHTYHWSMKLRKEQYAHVEKLVVAMKRMLRRSRVCFLATRVDIYASFSKDSSKISSDFMGNLWNQLVTLNISLKAPTGLLNTEADGTFMAELSIKSKSKETAVKQCTICLDPRI